MNGIKTRQEYENGSICMFLDDMGLCDRCIFRYLKFKNVELYRSEAEVLSAKKNEIIACFKKSVNSYEAEQSIADCQQGSPINLCTGGENIDLLKLREIIDGSNLNFNQSVSGESKILEFQAAAQDGLCVCCLGILQLLDNNDFIAYCRTKIENSGYKFETYLLTLSIPGAVYLRHHVVWHLLRRVFSNFECYGADCKIDQIPEVKEVFKWGMGSLVTSWSSIEYECNSKFEIRFLFTHFATENECLILDAIKGDSSHKPKVAANTNKKLKLLNDQNVNVEAASKNCKKLSISSIMSLVDELDGTLMLEMFAKINHTPQLSSIIENVIFLLIGNARGTCNVNVSFYRKSLYVAGRYCKYSRTMSQSPWIIDSVRKSEYSIQEIICSVLQKFYECESYKFISAGREDIDVRMLGSGRPFAVELINARNLHFDEYESIQAEINSCQPKSLLVFDLQCVEDSDLAALKEGEEKKRKTYQCLVRISQPLRPDMLSLLCQKKEFSIEQDTPIRVLHRRSLKTRIKVIHDMSVTSIDNNYVLLSLKTQAGTYIKEFVHSDFGRTRPSFCDLIGQADADLVLLDVTEVDLDFPKKHSKTTAIQSHAIAPPIYEGICEPVFANNTDKHL